MTSTQLDKRVESLEEKRTAQVQKPIYFMVEGQDPYPEDPSQYENIIIYQIIDSREDLERNRAEELASAQGE